MEISRPENIQGRQGNLDCIAAAVVVIIVNCVQLNRSFGVPPGIRKHVVLLNQTTFLFGGRFWSYVADGECYPGKNLFHAGQSSFYISIVLLLITVGMKLSGLGIRVAAALWDWDLFLFSLLSWLKFH